MLRMILDVIVVKYEPPVTHQVFALFLAMTCHILPGQCHTHAIMSGTLIVTLTHMFVSDHDQRLINITLTHIYVSDHQLINTCFAYHLRTHVNH